MDIVSGSYATLHVFYLLDKSGFFKLQDNIINGNGEGAELNPQKRKFKLQDKRQDFEKKLL